LCNEQFLFDHAAEIGLHYARNDPADRTFRPALHGRGRDHAFQEAMELIVRLNDVAIPPTVWRRYQKTETYMGTSDAA
jgi:hypothetical protein